MVEERQFQSLSKLFTAIKESAAGNESRNYHVDSGEFLRLLGLGKEKRHTAYLQEPIPNLPTMVLANHYVRPIYRRSWRFPFFLGTTGEALITTAILTDELIRLSDRKIAWLVKNDFSKTSASLSNKDIQIAAVKCYGQIPVLRETAGTAIVRAKNSLKDGFNVGFYCEGTVGGRLVQLGLKGYRFGDGSVFFVKTISHLGKAKIDFQILPVSIYYANGQFQTVFGKVINPREEPLSLAESIMQKIADPLPNNLK